MHDLFDRRTRRVATGLVERRPEGGTPVEVVMHRGKAYLRSVGGTGPASKAAWAQQPEIGYLAPLAIGSALLAVVVVATLAFMAAFAATFEAATRALPEGGLTAPRPDAAGALEIEGDRRREAL
ncbi:hypothetical protein [Tautonia plasticadhaerens]|uniref:Uncharacterized protein n=1 Tax=Tautonia plasticadhaerens TaxID=2527974 RepID=A0A518H9W0_9BACT|nr:hypothetical protein [Tautonia plasticadhaerens]QDV37629.1 hypothetical protein ElP_55700 [Tautonia plasticadhaerens]